MADAPHSLRQVVRYVAVTGVAILTVGVVWVLGPGAGWVLRHVDGVHGLKGKDLEDALNAVRGRALAAGTGLAALVAVYYTARNADTARRTFQLGQEGHVTERYTKAIEQLGSEKLDIRLGGIYALERIAADSARDHPTVMEVLTAFIREHTPIVEGLQPDVSLCQRPVADVQAAITVLGRRSAGYDIRPLDLAGANLVGANLEGANLSAVNLEGSHLSGVNLRHANLAGTSLRDADLTGANLRHAILTGANLFRATLSRAILVAANLSDAALLEANLTDANLLAADLVAANLFYTDLTRANLTRANLTGAKAATATFNDTKLSMARWSEGTRWPYREKDRISAVSVPLESPETGFRIGEGHVLPTHSEA